MARIQVIAQIEVPLTSNVSEIYDADVWIAPTSLRREPEYAYLEETGRKKVKVLQYRTYLRSLLWTQWKKKCQKQEQK